MNIDEMQAGREIPEWIRIDTHTSLYPKWRSLCVRCQSRKVGKKKECISWAKEHAENCEGATCEVCGHVFPGQSWDNCPICKESACAYNRMLDQRAALKVLGVDA